MSIAELKELVIAAYERTLDIDLAYSKCNVSAETQALMQEDNLFNLRIKSIEIECKEELFRTLKDLAGHGNPNVSLKATLAMLPIVYPERFGAKIEDTGKKSGQAVVNLYLPSNGRD